MGKSILCTRFETSFRSRLSVLPRGPRWPVAAVTEDKSVLVVRCRSSSDYFIAGRGGRFNVFVARAGNVKAANAINGVEVHSCLPPEGRQEFVALHNEILTTPLSAEALAFIELMPASLRETARSQYLPKSPDWFERQAAWLYVRRVEDCDRWADFVARWWTDILRAAKDHPSALW